MTIGGGNKTHRWFWIVAVIGCIGFITAAACLIDQHRTITRRMGWKCVSVADTKYAQYPHVEAAGPRLCANLQGSGASDVEMTFDTWGNRFWGFHGYDTTKLTANGKDIVLYDSSSGGFHDDEAHYGSFSSADDKKQHPEKYKFPIDTFTP